MVEHRDVLGDADRVARRQHDAELTDAQAPGLHRDEEVEQHGVVRELEALDVEVMLGEADRVVAEVVGEPRLLPHLGEHRAVERGVEPGAPALDVGATADTGQIEERGAKVAHESAPIMPAVATSRSVR